MILNLEEKNVYDPSFEKNIWSGAGGEDVSGPRQGRKKIEFSQQGGEWDFKVKLHQQKRIWCEGWKVNGM